jgi:hypothetical protein
VKFKFGFDDIPPHNDLFDIGEFEDWTVSYQICLLNCARLRIKIEGDTQEATQSRNQSLILDIYQQRRTVATSNLQYCRIKECNIRGLEWAMGARTPKPVGTLGGGNKLRKLNECSNKLCSYAVHDSHKSQLSFITAARWSVIDE